jgi:hypothetical protein
MNKAIFVTILTLTTFSAFALPTKSDLKAAIDATDIERIVKVEASASTPAMAGLESVDVIGGIDSELNIQTIYIYSGETNSVVSKKFKAHKIGQ